MRLRQVRCCHCTCAEESGLKQERQGALHRQHLTSGCVRNCVTCLLCLFAVQACVSLTAIVSQSRAGCPASCSGGSATLSHAGSTPGRWGGGCSFRTRACVCVCVLGLFVKVPQWHVPDTRRHGRHCCTAYRSVEHAMMVAFCCCVCRLGLGVRALVTAASDA